MSRDTAKYQILAITKDNRAFVEPKGRGVSLRTADKRCDEHRRAQRAGLRPSEVSYYVLRRADEPCPPTREAFARGALTSGERIYGEARLFENA